MGFFIGRYMPAHSIKKELEKPNMHFCGMNIYFECISFFKWTCTINYTYDSLFCNETNVLFNICTIFLLFNTQVAVYTAVSG